jgi:enoyl-CoA hydratase/carnithine racemase
MSERVTISISAGVADVRFNRPDKRNALDSQMFSAIVEAGESLKNEKGVRAVVISGVGASFCAGLDFSSFQAMSGGGDKSERPTAGITDIAPGRITHHGQQASWVWQELPVPVIAAVHGHALGGGIQIALGADIRIVHPDTKLSVRETYWGLVPDMTGTLTLSKVCGLDVAKELTFTSRIFSGSEAKELGLATKLSETPYEDALALAAEIASRNPDAIRAAKRLFANLSNTQAADQFAMERSEIGALIGSPNQVEAVMAGFEKREPNFAD